MKKSSNLPRDDTPYRRLQQHLDRQPVGFPPSGTGADIRLLKHIFTPEEARIAACLSHAPEPLETIFDRAGHLVSSAHDLENNLMAMIKKGGLEFRQIKGRNHFANAPLVVGIYEFQVNRLTPEFIRDFKAYTSEKRYGISFLGTRRSQMRTVPIHKSITPNLPVADFDQIITLLDHAAPPFVILPCICRKKKAIQGMACEQTDRGETCLALGPIAQTLIRMEIGRQIPRSEAMEIIRQNQRDGLVLQPSNTRNIEFLCSCCGCCCSMLGLQKDLPRPLDFWESGFTVNLDQSRCVGCGKCIESCQTQALTMAALASKTEKKDRSKPTLTPGRCIGCGHCVPACKTGALSLTPRPGRQVPPENREELNTILLEKRKNPLAPIKVIGKLARGIIATRDIRLLKHKD